MSAHHPFTDMETIKKAFHNLSSRVQPDRVALAAVAYLHEQNRTKAWGQELTVESLAEQTEVIFVVRRSNPDLCSKLAASALLASPT